MQAPEAHARWRADAVMSGLGKAMPGALTQPTSTAPINADADDFMIELPFCCTAMAEAITSKIWRLSVDVPSPAENAKRRAKGKLASYKPMDTNGQ